MFEEMVESTKQKQGGRTGRLFLVTGVIYAAVLTAVGVATVFWFNPALAETMDLQTMLSPPPPPGPPQPPIQERRTATPTVERIIFTPPVNLKPPTDPVPPLVVSRDPGAFVQGGFTGPSNGPGIISASNPRDEDLTPPPPTPRPTVTPVPTPTPQKIPVSEGVLLGKAIKRYTPPYPAIARAARASGPVQVMVTISEEGQVINATAVSGHPLLREASVQAARQWVFSPTLLSKQPVKIQGILTFNFTLN